MADCAKQRTAFKEIIDIMFPAYPGQLPQDNLMPAMQPVQGFDRLLVHLTSPLSVPDPVRPPYLPDPVPHIFMLSVFSFFVSFVSFILLLLFSLRCRAFFSLLSPGIVYTISFQHCPQYVFPVCLPVFSVPHILLPAFFHLSQASSR